MSPGRCGGCGYSDKSCKVVRNHIMACPDAIELMKTAPTALLDPALEYERWKTEEDTSDARDDARQKRIAASRARADNRNQVNRSRWQSKDPLA